MYRRVLVLAIAIGVLLAPATVHAADLSNAECLECHDVASGGPAFTTVDFSVGAVDYNNCSSCHWIGMTELIWGRWSHSHITAEPGELCSACHYPMDPYPDLPYFYTPTYATAYGNFDTAASLSKTPAQLHSIHVNGSWPQTQDRRLPNYCGSCHAPTGCSSCHTPPVAHEEHTINASGTAAYPPVTYGQAGGTTPGNPDQLTITSSASYCVNDACHSRASAANPAFVPECGSCHPESSSGHREIHDVSALMTKGCIRCHGTHLDAIHSDTGVDCDACHTPAAQLDESTMACVSCHEDGGHFGRRR